MSRRSGGMMGMVETCAVTERTHLQQRLAEVLAEQDSRSRLHEANGQA